MPTRVASDELLDELRLVADPLADGVVAAHFADRQRTPGELFTALVRHPADPTAAQAGPVTEFLAAVPEWPDWVDPDQIRAGQRFFEQWGPQILSGLLFASLPDAYAAAKGVQVLHLTARLASDPRRRLIETTQMVVDCMSVGGLAVGARGYTTARRVRLMHAAVRYLIAHDPYVTHSCDESVERRWCPDWGVPINQEDLLGTLLTFTSVIFESLDRSGVEVADADAEAYLHAWNVIGFLLGIRPDLLPLDRSRAAELRAVIIRRQYASSPAGHEMAMALERLAASQTRPRLLSGLPRSAMRYFIGDEVADLLGLPSADWTRLLFGPARRVMTRLSLDDQHDRLMRLVTSRLNHLMISGFVDVERIGDRAAFSLPTHLADAWSIPEAAPGRATARGQQSAAGIGTG